MSRKSIIRTITDIAMLVLLPLLMAYSLVGETTHEWLGMTMLALFILHHVLNHGWYKSLFRGKYSAFRTVLTLVNSLLLAGFVMQFVSGIDLSNHIFPLLPTLTSASLSRVIHLSGAHWGTLLMSFHLGLHVNRFIKQLNAQRAVNRLLTTLAYSVAIYGVYAFFNESFPSYLLPTSMFLFFDEGRPFVLFLLNVLSILVLFTLLGHWTAQQTKLKLSKKEVTKR